jgi:hypothetical protein
MEPELLEILREAIETRQRKEELDRSIGRALRRRDMNFNTFVKMISELRELAGKKDISIDDAATELLAQHQKDAD